MLPMGTLANGDLRHKRILAHRALKKLQQDCHMEKWEVYIWLQAKLGLDAHQTHIGKSFPSVSRLRRTHPGVLPERR